MKKFIAIAALIMMPFFATAAKYTEGVQYTKVSDVRSKNTEVREYFSFYCPHCKSFEPFMNELKQQLPMGVVFEYNHVDFLRAASTEIQAMLSKAVVVAEQLGMQKTLIPALFNHIQVQRATITSEKDIVDLFVLNGADAEKTNKLMKSFTVNSKAKQMKKNQTALSKNRGITGVPAVVVNGKYRINTDKLDKDNFKKDYHQLVTFLLALD